MAPRSVGKAKRAKRAVQKGRQAHGGRSSRWWELPESRLLDVRLCDLGLRLEESPLADRVEALRAELRRRRLAFQPKVWLSDEWFSPLGVAGFAIPFYLAHPRLARLERKQMFMIEGGGHVECMRLLRHETGHALDSAYRLRRRKLYRETFGRSSEPYRSTYVPNPRSKRFVLNLDSWYAQSHPIEDFAETFAVWLDPSSSWRKRYAGWPALAKLELVDGWMEELAGRKPVGTERRQVDPLTKQRITLREYYECKRASYGTAPPSGSHYGLAKLFSDDPRYMSRESAASFLRRHRAMLRRRVAEFTEQHPYAVDQALREMIQACTERRLRLVRSQAETHLDAVSLLSARTMRFAVDGRRTFVR